MEVKDWIARELAAVEALLAGAPPSCQLDRQRASSASAKQLEGRHVVLRRAARLLDTGQALDALQAEADKARILLASDQGIAQDPAWRAYSTGVLTAFEELQQQLASSGR
jgi:hypothetical protein